MENPMLDSPSGFDQIPPASAPKDCWTENPTPPMLVNQIARLFRNRLHEGDAETSVFRSESNRALLRLLEQESGITQLGLAQRTHLKPSTVSIALRKLEAQELVIRQQDEQDARTMRVTLSDKGRELCEQNKRKKHGIDEILMQGFSPEETALLTGFLLRMRTKLLEAKA